MLSPDKIALATSVAHNLGIPDPNWLVALIQHESGFEPGAYNPGSGATGLIQFIPRTMKDFGFLPLSVSSQIPDTGEVPAAVKEACRSEFLARFPDAERQMKGPVTDYLKRYAPYPTEQSLYLAVFYPAYRGKSLDTTFPTGVSKANPGIDTVADYVASVRANLAAYAATDTGKGTGVILLAVIGAGLYFWHSSSS